MLTTRGKTLIASTVALWLLSRVFGIAELAMAAVAVLALVLLAVAYTALASATLTARRTVQPSRLFFDAHGEVELVITNIGRLATAILQVEDRIPTSLADNPRFVLTPIRGGGSVSLRYGLHGRHRGRFEAGPLEIRLRDPFGIASRPRRFGDTDEVIVYPPVWRLEAGVPLGGSMATGGEGRPRPLAGGDELANVRDYVRGDDLRKVHWRSTAHRGKLMIRQDESPQNPQATVVLDVRRDAHHGVGAASSFELAVSAAASVTYHLSERAYGTCLLTAPDSPRRGLPWQVALDQLAVMEPSDGADLNGLWQQMSQGAVGDGLLVAVVATPDPLALRRMVRAGRAYSSRAVLLLDTASFGAQRRDPGVPVARTADALRAADWRVGVLRSGDRLDVAWRDLLLQRGGAPIPTATGPRS